MSVLRRAKLRTPDGTESIEYPLGVDAENVEVANQENLSQRLVRIDEDLENNEEDIAAVNELAGTNKQNIGANEIRIDALERRSASIDKKPYYFDTVADMKAYQELKEGDMAITLGYYEANDNGGAQYMIVDGNYTDNGGSYHELTNGLFATLIINDNKINIKQFGAKADGVTDDTLSIQNAIDIAKNTKKNIIFQKGTYIITNSIRIYEGQHIDGNNCTIKGNFNGSLIYCTVAGSITIENLNLSGANNSEYTDNIGLSMICYYSTFKNLKINNCYKGISLGTAGASGTLVENRITDCIFRGNQQSLDLGPADNNKLTDGFLSNIIINNSGENYAAIYIGSAAGWLINNIHIYGENYNGISIKNGFHTNIDNIYIERSSHNLIDCSGTQIDVNISNITGNLTQENNIGIFCQRGGYTPNGNASFNISNVYLAVATNANSSYGIYDGLTSPVIHLSNYRYVKKSSETTFTPIKVQTLSNIYDSSNIYITNDKRLSNDSHGKLFFGSNPIIEGYAAMVEYIGEKTINIPVYRTLDGYDMIEFNIHLQGNEN